MALRSVSLGPPNGTNCQRHACADTSVNATLQPYGDPSLVLPNILKCVPFIYILRQCFSSCDCSLEEWSVDRGKENFLSMLV